MDAVARLLVWLDLITSNRSNSGQTAMSPIRRKSAACCQGEGREESEDARGDEEGDLFAVWWSAMMCENQSAKGPGM